MKTIASALLVGASLLASAPASAATVVFSFGGNNDVGGTVQQFNPQFGTLNSASFEALFTGYASTTRSPSATADALSAPAFGTGELRSSSGGSGIFIPTVQLNGSNNFAAGSRTGSCTVSGTGSGTLSGAALNPFIGSGTTQIFGGANVGFCSGGDMTFTPRGGTFSGTVTYDYTAAIPEPATWSMMLVGFAGCGMAIRRSKATKRHQIAEPAGQKAGAINRSGRQLDQMAFRCQRTG